MDNVNSTVNSLGYNKASDIPVPVKHEYTIYNSLFQTNEYNKYTCELCTRPNQIQRERKASGNSLS